MARTKPDIDREQKRREIVAAARSLFIEQGFETTPVTRIAAAAKVAPNTLYWYFADKDAILVAVLDDLVLEGMKHFGKLQRASIGKQLNWLLDMLSELQGLIATLHMRMEQSASLHAWHDGFHELAEAFIAEQLRAHGIARRHEGDAARIAMFIVEGLLAHHVDADERRRLVRWLLSEIAGGGSTTKNRSGRRTSDSPTAANRGNA